MNSKKTGYGIYDISRSIARRVQRAWDETENAPLAQIIAFPSAEILPFPPQPPATARKEKRPLAA